MRLRKKFSHFSLLITLIFVTILFLSLVIGSISVTPTYAQEALPADYVKKGLDIIDMEEFKGYIQDLTGFGSRFTGYPGSYAAADYIEEKFRSFGITNIERHQYNLVIPKDEGAYLELPRGEKVTLYPMFPNKVSPPQTPPGGLTGPLIYVGEGGLKDLENAAKKSGKGIEGSIVLMDFNTQYHWVTAAKLGAQAVIFIEPSDTSMMEAWMKWIESVAWNFPRVYVKAEDAQKLLALAEETPTVTLVSNMKWRRTVAENIIAYLPGSDYPDQYVLLTAGYDSFSFIPSVAPGAREAIGMAMVLQLARYYASHPELVKYTLVFIGFSGTAQGVIGSRWFVKDYVDNNWDEWGSKIALQINFDINDANRWMMPTHVAGWTHNWREGTAPWVQVYETWLFRTLIPDLAEKLGRSELTRDDIVDQTIVPRRIVRAMLGGGGPGHGIIYHDYLGSPGRYMNNEPLLSLGGPGYSWTNAFAFSREYYTPFDLPENIRWENVQYKLEAIYPIVHATITADLSYLIKPWSPGPPGMFYPKWVDTVGEIKRYNVTSGWYDPLPNALIYYTRGGPSGTYGGAYIGMVSYMRLLPVYDMADEEGKVFLPGLMQSQRLGSYTFESYIVDESTGNVLYAPGFGADWYPNTVIDIGDGNDWSSYGNDILNEKTQSFGVYTLFKSGTIVLFDVGDLYVRSGPQDAELRIIVNEFVSHAPPRQWSWDVYMYSGHSVSVAATFVPPDTPVELMTKTSYTLRSPMSLLINASEDKPLGSGFTLSAGEQYTLTHTKLRIALDLYYLNRERANVLTTRGITPAGVTKTKSLIEETITAIEKHEYMKAEALSNRLPIFGRDNYVNVRNTTEDTIYAITFFGLTLIPFAVITERLFTSTQGPKRVVATVASYAIPLIFFWLVHPGFALASNPFMVVIGFLVVVLIMPLLAVILNIALSTLKHLRETVSGVHWVEIPRFSVALLGLSTGISHMRKRRLLTALTLISVTFVTMGISMFTSMQAMRVLTVGRTPWPAAYDGILFHMWDYSSGGFGDWGQTVPQVGERILNELQVRYGDKAIVVPRAWTWMGYLIRGTHISDDKGNVVATPIVAFLGLTPQEQEVTAPQAALTDERGKSTWFTEEMADKPVAIISRKLAEVGDLRVGDTIWVSGYSFKLVGIVDDEKFLQIYDLDDLWLTPWDQRIPGFEGRVLPKETIIIPYKTLLSTVKGWIVSVAVRFKPEYATKETIFTAATEFFSETLGKEPGIPLYIGLDGVVYSLLPQNFVTIFGWEQQVVPLILAAFLVLGLVTSSIEQRKSDIYVLSTVGLSPFHVGFLFLSESITYSVVGGIFGYLLGIIATIVIGYTPWGAGFQLNYASTTVVTTIAALMAAIIAVTLYPIYRAARLVTPSLERRWKIPKAKGDHWEIPLPFTLAEDIRADGVIAFIHEVLTGHMVEDAELFRVRRPIRYVEQEAPNTLTRSMVFESDLAPYELGIRHTVSISDVKDIKTNRHSFLVRLERTSGPRGSWRTFGREFVDTIRKQTILWGSIKPEEREEYQRRFRKILRDMEHVGGGQ